MDESIPSLIYPHMGDPFTLRGGKEDQVSLHDLVLFDRGTRLELGSGGAGQLKAVQMVNCHSKAAAVETLLRGRSAPSIGQADKALCGLNDLIPEMPSSAGSPFCHRITLWRYNVIPINDAR